MQGGGGDGDVSATDEQLQKEAIAWAKKMFGYGEKNMTFRQKLWTFLDEPGSSTAAMMFTMVGSRRPFTFASIRCSSE